MMPRVDYPDCSPAPRSPCARSWTSGSDAARGCIELELFDRSMALAGQVFAALLPLLIVIGAASPADGRDVADTLIERVQALGLGRGRAAQRADQAARTRELGEHRSPSCILAISALSFTRAMQRLYVRAWRLPGDGPARQRVGARLAGVVHRLDARSSR